MTGDDWATVIGAIILIVGFAIAAAYVIYLVIRGKLATAWDFGYNTRSYDEVTNMVSPNPYTTGEYPNPDPVRCRPECEDEHQAERWLADRHAEILTKVADGLQGEPHPLTDHDHSQLGDLAYAVNTRDKCWDPSGPSAGPCILTVDHRGQHRDEFGNNWHNMAGFHPAARKDNQR